MFCVKCGNRLDEGTAFCPECGTAVSVPQMPGTAPQAAPAGQATGSDEKYCFSCGSPVKKAAAICPRCGVDQNARNSAMTVDVYCTSCGRSIKKEASVCPFCGVMQGAAPQAAPANQPDSKLKPLLILSIIAPLVYVVYLVTGSIRYDTHSMNPFVDAVLLCGCLFVQGILAFIHGTERGKTSITVTAFIALLWYAVVLGGITTLSIINNYNYVANIFFDGFDSFFDGSFFAYFGIIDIMELLLFLLMYLYPLVVCALAAVWCAASIRRKQ